MSASTPTEPADPTGSGPVHVADEGGRRRGGAVGAFAPGGWGRRFTKLWGFLGFCILILFLARHVVLPFVFAALIAYILSPIVNRLSRPNGKRPRMPRGVAIILCYVVLLGLIALFAVTLLPRISRDVARIGREAPSLYKKLNDEWAPQVAAWLEKRFPSMKEQMPEPAAPVIADVPTPPATQFVLTPLPDGRWSVQLEPTGIDVIPRAGGGVTVAPRTQPHETPRLEDQLRGMARDALSGLQHQLGDVFRFGQRVVTAVIKSVFGFFLVLMIGAFILLDIEKIHGFCRGLVPAVYRDDYDVIVHGIDRGLSGVIRGQLMICLLNGILTWVGLVIFDVNYAPLLAVVAAVLSLIPIFGSILSSVPIVLAAFVSNKHGVDLIKALAILGWIIGIHFVEANLFNPKIIGSQARIHPVVVIFALVLGEHSYGLTGALLAVPVASIVQVLFMFFRRKAWRDLAPAAAPPP